MTDTAPLPPADHTLDITGDICPMTFVKTRLAIDKGRSGDVVEIRLTGKEPLENVPKNIRDHGHEILSLEAEPGETEDGVHRLLVRIA